MKSDGVALLLILLAVPALAEQVPETKEQCPDVSSCMDVCGAHAARGKFHSSHCTAVSAVG
jgi:hypothetical protein